MKAIVYFNEDSEPLMVVNDMICDVESNNGYDTNIIKWMSHFGCDGYDEVDIDNEEWDSMSYRFEWYDNIPGLI